MAAASSNLFFPPTFFSPFYFAEFAPFGQDGTDSPDAWGATYRDRDAFLAIRVALLVTEQFADVQLGFTPEQWTSGADRTPVAVITPDSWIELDDVDPVVSLRQVFFSLTVIVRDENAFTRYESLDRLSCLSQNVLDGTDLGGVCFPVLTKIRRGRFDAKSRHPEQAVILNGEFSYMIPAFNGHNTDP